MSHACQYNEEAESWRKLRTWSRDLTLDDSQSCNSLWRVDTSSTEHFLAATLATLDSNRSFDFRPAERLSSPSDSTITSCTPLAARGVDQPLLTGVKSTRMIRTESLENWSRQKGQHGLRLGVLLSRMLVKHWRHRMCPERVAQGWGSVQ